MDSIGKKSEPVKEMIVDVLLDALKGSTSNPWSGEIIPIQLTQGHCMLWFKPESDVSNNKPTNLINVTIPTKSSERIPQPSVKPSSIPIYVTSQTSQTTPGLRYGLKGGSMIESTRSSIPSVLETRRWMKRSNEDVASLNNLFDQEESLTRDSKLSASLRKSSFKSRETSSRKSATLKQKSKSSRDKVVVKSPSKDDDNSVRKTSITLNVSGKDVVVDGTLNENGDCLKFFNQISEEMKQNPFLNPTEEIEKHLKTCHLHRKADDESIMQMRLARAVIKHNRKILEKLETLRYSTSKVTSDSSLDSQGVCPGGRCQFTKASRSKGGSTPVHKRSRSSSAVVTTKRCPNCCTQPVCKCEMQSHETCCPRPIKVCSHSQHATTPHQPSICSPLLPPSCPLPCSRPSSCSMEACHRPVSTCSPCASSPCASSPCASCPLTPQNRCATGTCPLTLKGGTSPCSHSNPGCGGSAYANISGICVSGSCPYVKKSQSKRGAKIKERKSATAPPEQEEKGNEGGGEQTTPTIEVSDENKLESSNSTSNSESPCSTGTCSRVKQSNCTTGNCPYVPRSQRPTEGCTTGACPYVSPSKCSSGACGYVPKPVQTTHPNCACGTRSKSNMSKVAVSEISVSASGRSSPCVGGACSRSTQRTMNCPGGNCPYVKKRG